MRNKAFTLAEVLITLTIIGVIAALTIPNLIQSYRKHQVEVGVKEAYSIINNALKISQSENGQLSEIMPDCFEATITNDFVNNYITPYLKYTEKIDGQVNRQCPYPFASKDNKPYLTGVDGTNSGPYTCYMPKLVLANGMILGVSDGGCYSSLTFIVDINGRHGPNKMGHDIHSFTQFKPGSGACKSNGYNNPFCNKGNILFGGNAPYEIYQSSTACSGGGMNCTYYIVKNGFKIPDDYPVKKW